jgi:hypothetical protein
VEGQARPQELEPRFTEATEQLSEWLRVYARWAQQERIRRQSVRPFTPKPFGHALMRLKFRYWDSLGAVADLVNDWKAFRCKTEKDYERSLYTFLHKSLDGIQVTKQFANGRVRADLVVGNKVMIELKVNLDSTGTYQRLIGQLEDYQDWKGDIVIVLLGRTDPNLRKKLDGQVAKRSGFLAFDQQLRVVQK